MLLHVVGTRELLRASRMRASDRLGVRVVLGVPRGVTRSCEESRALMRVGVLAWVFLLRRLPSADSDWCFNWKLGGWRKCWVLGMR